MVFLAKKRAENVPKQSNNYLFLLFFGDSLIVIYRGLSFLNSHFVL